MTHEHKILFRYVAEMLGTLVLYSVVLVISIEEGRSLPHGFGRTVVLFSPMVPVLLMIFVVARYFRQADEYLRLRILENWAMTAASTAAGTFAYGFLENAGFPRLSMFTVMPAMGCLSALLFLLRRILGR